VRLIGAGKNEKQVLSLKQEEVLLETCGSSVQMVAEDHENLFAQL
jgi:hypothetical protein